MKFAKKITQIILLVFIFDINIKMQLVNQIGANIELSQFDDSNILIDGYFDKSTFYEPKRRCPSLRLVKDVLKWKPKVNLNDGLDLTIEYFKN